jgi:hypothetical protein
MKNIRPFLLAALNGYILVFFLINNRLDDLIDQLDKDGHTWKARFLQSARLGTLLSVALHSYRAN